MTERATMHPALDPHHLDDVATDLLISASHAAEVTLARRAEMDKAGKSDQPLIVLKGEHHHTPWDHLHHFFFLQELLQREERVACCFEAPHNVLATQFTLHEKRVSTEEQAFRFRELERTGILSLKSSLGFVATFDADHTRSILRYFMLRQRVSARFTDVSFVMRGTKILKILDEEDSSTTDSIRACFNKLSGENINAILPDGMRVRNHHMAKLAVDFAKVTHARIVIQQCGNLHVLGSNDGNLAKNSLSAAAPFKEAGVSLLAMPILLDGIPKNHGLYPKEICFIERGRPAETAIYHPFNDQADPRRPAHFECRADEAAFTNGILQRAGMEDACLTPESWREKKVLCRAEMVQIFKQG
jgi:hypothetical protein